MNKFKVGDKVRCNKPEIFFNGTVSYILHDTDRIQVTQGETVAWFNADDLELVEEKPERTRSIFTFGAG